MFKWHNEGRTSLWLVTLDEYKQIPAGVKLECIDGTFAVKGTDYIDLDTRMGHLAYGVRDPLNHEYKDLFQLFMI